MTSRADQYSFSGTSSTDTHTHSKRKGGTNISGTISRTTCRFMSMFNDIDSSNKNKEEQYLENVMEIGTDAEQIQQGQWCFCGPGLEKHGAETAHKKGTGTTVRYRWRKSSSSPTIQHDIHCSSPFSVEFTHLSFVVSLTSQSHRFQ